MSRQHLAVMALVLASGCVGIIDGRDDPRDEDSLGDPSDETPGDDDSTDETPGDGMANDDDVPPVVIGTCDDLPEAGVWEHISPIPGDGPPTGVSGEGTKWGAAGVAVHPYQLGTLYAGVARKGVWKSTDCGATWEKTNVGTNGDWIDLGIQFALRLVPGAEGDTLYANNFQSTPRLSPMMGSSNGGRDWQPMYADDSNVATTVQLGGYGNDVSVDPDDASHILLTFHANCDSPNGGCVGESEDGGATWTLWPGPLDGWQEHARPYFISRNTWLYAAHAGLWHTTDIEADDPWEKVALSAGAGGLYLSPTGKYYLGSDHGVLESADGHDWNVLPGSPQSTSVVGTGTTLYSGYMFANGPNVLWSAPEDNPTTWTQLTTPSMGTNGGSWTAGYDPAHHLYYTANHRSGLWRVVLP